MPIIVIFIDYNPPCKFLSCCSHVQLDGIQVVRARTHTHRHPQIVVITCFWDSTITGQMPTNSVSFSKGLLQGCSAFLGLYTLSDFTVLCISVFTEDMLTTRNSRYRICTSLERSDQDFAKSRQLQNSHSLNVHASCRHWPTRGHTCPCAHPPRVTGVQLCSMILIHFHTWELGYNPLLPL